MLEISSMTSVIRLVSAIAVVWLPTASFLASEVPAHVAMAGWAEVEITPPLGIGLGGRGGPETLANKILSPLFGQVLFLKDGKGRGFVLVSLDVVAIAHDLSDRIRTDIVQELGVDWNL